MDLIQAAPAGDVDEVRRLLANSKTKVDVTGREAVVFEGIISGRKATPLMIAAGYGHEAVCRILLDAGAAIDRATEEGDTPLALAAVMGRDETVRLLIERGANVSAANRKGDTPLHFAVRLCRFGCVRLLTEAGANLEAKDQFESTPLHWAVQLTQSAGIPSGPALASMATYYKKSIEEMREVFLQKQRDSFAIVKALLDAGADPNAVNSVRYTPLHEGVSGKDHVTVRMLLEHGADVGRTDIHGNIPLQHAYNDVEMVRLLLDAGSDPNHQDKDGETAALSAAEAECADVLEVLAKAGADLMLAARDGRTPMSVVADSGNRKLVENLTKLGVRATPDQSRALNDEDLRQAAESGDVERVRSLLKAGADPNVEKGGEPAIWLAARGGHTEIVEALLAAGVSPDAPGRYESTALHEAAEGGHAAVVRVLLAAGANVEAITDRAQEGFEGWTPLMAACEAGSASIVRLLLRAGANANARTKNGHTPLAIAALARSKATVERLTEAGAHIGTAEPHLLEMLECRDRLKTEEVRRAIEDLAAICETKPLRFAVFKEGVAFDPAKSRLVRDCQAPPHEDGIDRIAQAIGLDGPARKKITKSWVQIHPVDAVTHGIVETHGPAFRARGCSLVYVSMLPGDKLALLPTTDPLAVIAALGPGPQGIPDMIETLIALRTEVPFSIHGASGDTLFLRLEGTVADPDRLAKRLFGFGADEYGLLSNGGLVMTDRPKDLAPLLRLPNPMVRLWWD